MSEFDKEAERRRLREKYEEDQADRETTERMSQLLLQGATMTNHHCDTCGSPIFRYQGQEFCPTCQAEDEKTAQQAGGQADVQQAGDAQPAGTPEQSGTQQQSQGDQGTSTARNASAQNTGSRADPSQAPAPREDTTPTVPAPEALEVEEMGDVGQALASAIATLATRAEQTDDPRRAKEFLEAAHEAAETLRTLHG